MSSSNVNIRSGAFVALAAALKEYAKLYKRSNGALFDVRISMKTSRGKTVKLELSRAPQAGQWIAYFPEENKLRYVANPETFVRSYVRAPGLQITKIYFGYDGKNGLPANAKKTSPKKK
jgi:hypothetical protein